MSISQVLREQNAEGCHSSTPRGKVDTRANWRQVAPVHSGYHGGSNIQASGNFIIDVDIFAGVGYIRYAATKLQVLNPAYKTVCTSYFFVGAIA